ncbi:uncharacterized protein GLRG_00917 [Colletotrichum graminicola M1.001]|uniref:Uncharacterized protein n=1 Tax=Colletotrichum graminicola (strain M1.001 / M2 / FGSC 10212) TaxID=645133 RepID=E3Q504_COLGM|nr:uncharacterized protein GLRG_00917 [Colletotrichum graminicola M1.001]EFQ25773.1 hypothetical protein GLRG_00917 [Colletotrichum graminicola M1.001]
MGRLPTHVWLIALLSIYSLIMTVFVMVVAEACKVNLSPSLGGDPNGFVPSGVGEPLRWRTFVRNDSNPYYIPDDVFEDKAKTRKVVNSLVTIHSSIVRINGRHGRWVHDNGRVSTLPAIYTPPSMGEEQVYVLRGLYQMRCIIVLLEAYGHSIQKRPHHGEDDDGQDVWHWPPEHVAYCLNVLADGVQCMADATPLSFVNGFGSGHLTDGQQAWCRDWEGLSGWAAREERRVATAQGGAALKGPFGRLWRTILP